MGLICFPADVDNLLAALAKLSPELNDKEDDIKYITNVVASKDFRILMKVCEFLSAIFFF